MKIAYTLGSLSRGGTETLLLDIFKNTSKAGYEFIGIHRKDGDLKSDFYATGQKIVQLSPKFMFDIVYFLKLRKLLKKENIRIVHAQQPLDALYAWIATLFSTIKVALTFHGYDDFDKKNRMINFIIKRTDKNIYVSNFQREYYTKKYHLKPAKQQTVYNGVSFNKIDSADTTPDYLTKNDLQQARLKMAMVGNFVRGREQYSVCKFLKLLHNENIEFDFYFVGARNLAEPWRYDCCVQYCNENGLSDSVHFLGSRNDIPAILKNIDAFVYSTEHDTFGIAVVEAMAAELPIFVNDWEVMTEITNNGKWATVYRTKNEHDLLAKFLLFLQNRNEYTVKAKNASQAVRTKFSIEMHLQNLQKEYEKIC
jgi:glycosyltransferase involved in cell wall biosynthesis